ETRVALAKHDPLQAAVAWNQKQSVAEKRPVVRVGLRVEQVNACQVALAPTRGRESAGAADGEKLASPAGLLQTAPHVLQADAVAANDDHVGGLHALRKQMYLHRLACFQVLALARDNHESVRATECGDRAGALAHRIGDERRCRLACALVAARRASTVTSPGTASGGDKSDEEILRPATLGVDT